MPELMLVRAQPPLADAPLTNAGALAGAVAVIGRGVVPFLEKVRRAQAAGAVGVIIVNSEDELLPIRDDEAGDITIPIVCVASSFQLADMPALLEAWRK